MHHVEQQVRTQRDIVERGGSILFEDQPRKSVRGVGPVRRLTAHVVGSRVGGMALLANVDG